MIFEERWVRSNLAPGLDSSDVRESFYSVLEEKFKLPMTGEQHSISAVILDKPAMKIFQLKQATAALLVQGTGFVKKRTPLWYQRLLYRGDHYQLHNKTHAASAASAIELRLSDYRKTALTL